MLSLRLIRYAATPLFFLRREAQAAAFALFFADVTRRAADDIIDYHVADAHAASCHAAALSRHIFDFFFVFSLMPPFAISPLLRFFASGFRRFIFFDYLIFCLRFAIRIILMLPPRFAAVLLDIRYFLDIILRFSLSPPPLSSMPLLVSLIRYAAASAATPLVATRPFYLLFHVFFSPLRHAAISMLSSLC